MIRLTLFGKLDLTGHNGAGAEAVLQQPKRLAVLIYLVLAGPGSARTRDAALCMFWPEATLKRARHALNQTLHFLRQALGPDTVKTRGAGELSICPASTWCDAVAFDDALTRGDAAAALELYRGELLPGFFIDAGPEFDQWLSSERERYRRTATVAAWRLADAAEASGDLAVAADYARRGVEVSQHDEQAVQKLIRLLARANDRHGALRAYEYFRLRLEREYEAQPAVETVRLIESIRSWDAVESSALAEADAAEFGAHPSAAAVGATDVADIGQDSAGSLGRSRRRGWLVFGATAAAALVALAVHTSRARAAAEAGLDSEQRTSVTIGLLTGVDKSPASASLGRALTAGVIDQLAHVSSFDIAEGPIRGDGSTPLRNGSGAARADRAHLLLTGAISQFAGRVRVNVQIADMASRRVVKSATLEHAPYGKLALVDTLSREIATLVRTAAGREARLRQWSSTIDNGRAYGLMQQAEAYRDMAAQFERAGNLSAVVRALRAADTTLASVVSIAPRSGAPRVEHARVLLRLGALYMLPGLGSPPATEALFRRGISEAARAVALDDHDAVALESLGTLAYWYWLSVPLPRDSAAQIFRLAERNLKAAVAADLGRAEAWSLLSAMRYATADFVGARLAAGRAYDGDAYLSNPQEILSRLSLTSYELGDAAGARQWCDELTQRYGDSWLAGYCQLYVLASSGLRGSQAHAIDRAWQITRKAGSRESHGRRVESHLTVMTAAVLARYGMRDSAESVLNRATAADRADVEIIPEEAYVRVLLGQDSAAAVLLVGYAAADPVHRAGAVRSRRFSTVAGLQRSLSRLGVPTVQR